MIIYGLRRNYNLIFIYENKIQFNISNKNIRVKYHTISNKILCTNAFNIHIYLLYTKYMNMCSSTIKRKTTLPLR